MEKLKRLLTQLIKKKPELPVRPETDVVQFESLKKKAEEEKDSWNEDLEFKASQVLYDWLKNCENLHSLHTACKKNHWGREVCQNRSL